MSQCHTCHRGGGSVTLCDKCDKCAEQATTNGQAKYYPSTAFLPSVALGTLLTRNWVSVLIDVAALGNLECLGYDVSP